MRIDVNSTYNHEGFSLLARVNGYVSTPGFHCRYEQVVAIFDVTVKGDLPDNVVELKR